MKVTRMYTGEDKQSHFEDPEIPMIPDKFGAKSDHLPGAGVFFQQNPEGASIGFHNASQRQFVITLSGVGELELGDGSRRQFGPGDILLADDTTGQGHITRIIQGPRRCVFVPLPAQFDLEAWRVQKSPK